MATRYDIAQRLFKADRKSSVSKLTANRSGAVVGGPSDTASVGTGYAQGDSANGRVDVLFDTSGIVDPEDAVPVSCSCDSPIYDGQRVTVIRTGSGTLKAIPIGDNIADMSIRGVDVQYALSSSSTRAPSSGWSSTPPSTIPDGQYLWQRTATTSGTGEVSYSAAVCITSGDGKDGRGVEDIQEQYYLSTSSTRQTGGSWQSTCPEWVDGRYIWTRSRIEWTDGTTTYTTPVLASAINQANENAAKATQYCWNDYEGTHVSTSPNSTSGSNVLLDSGGLAIRNGTTEIATYEADRVFLMDGAIQIRHDSSDGISRIFGSDLRLAASIGYTTPSVSVKELTYYSPCAITCAASSSGRLTSSDSAIPIGTITAKCDPMDEKMFTTGTRYVRVNVPSYASSVTVEVSASGTFEVGGTGANLAVSIAAQSSSSFNQSTADYLAALIQTSDFSSGWSSFAITPITFTFTSSRYLFLVARCAKGGTWETFNSSSMSPRLTVRVVSVDRVE